MRCLLLLVLCSCGRRDPPALGEMVEFARRTDQVGDRFEVEMPSKRERILEEGEGTVKTSAVTERWHWSDEVLEVKDGRASRTRRTFAAIGKDPPLVVEADLLEREGWLDFFGQFERLLPARARLRETWTAGGLTGPGVLFTHDESTMRAARATCTLRRVALWEEEAEIERVAEIDVVIRLSEVARPSKLEGTMSFGLQSGMLLQLELGAHEDGTTYTLTGKRTLHPAEPAEADGK
ncbi:MAG: hypothetical protein ACHQ1G_02215 [Planctomycetota bacterium]